MTRLPTLRRRSPQRRSAQRGVALIVALILLVVALIVGLAASRGTLLEEKMSANLYDRSLAFQRAEGFTPPEWPRADRNSQQFHLDFDSGPTWEEMDAAHEKVLALGARPLDLTDRENKDFQVYADPAGHPFCLCRIEPA